MEFPVPLSLPALIVSAFAVSLATVVVPGPITLVLSRLAISQRTSRAVWFLVGCLLVDVVLFMALAGGAAPVLRRLGALPAVEIVGGFALLWGGWSSLRHRPAPKDPERAAHLEGYPAYRAVLTGMVVCLGNLHYWFWWCTAGLAFVEAARAHGYPGLLWILIALIAGVVAWYAPLLWALHHGRSLLTPRSERWVIIGIGAILLAIGSTLLVIGSFRFWLRYLAPWFR
ncbi:MAG: LysE family transporter [Thermoanaerobaculaceae bacterium]|nr:LysE family transporter [Thermoanaerobaculaceae bacterium]MDI9622654.1 LysE family transporter [Acidobacteriota bacterium]NLH10515.1 LysE family transporter [Holophagae bacterium]HPW54597.1 LysE family transporter [Thermoanaerobaculaceae bacterium]